MIVQIFDDEGKLSKIIKFRDGMETTEVMDMIVNVVDDFRYDYEIIEVD
jgi:hypothetical protein